MTQAFHSHYSWSRHDIATSGVAQTSVSFGPDDLCLYQGRCDLGATVYAGILDASDDLWIREIAQILIRYSYTGYKEEKRESKQLNIVSTMPSRRPPCF